MTTDVSDRSTDKTMAGVRHGWLFGSERRYLRLALVAMVIGLVGSALVHVANTNGLSHSLAMKIQWHIYNGLSLDRFGKYLFAIPVVIGTLGLIGTLWIFLPALTRRLSLKYQRVIHFIWISLLIAFFSLGPYLLLWLSWSKIVANWKFFVSRQVGESASWRQQFNIFMMNNQDWVVPLAFLTLLVVLIVIAGLLLAMFQRMKNAKPPGT
jgi:hypothetical protein